MGGEESSSSSSSFLFLPNDFQTIAYWPRADPTEKGKEEEEEENVRWVA